METYHYKVSCTMMMNVDMITCDQERESVRDVHTDSVCLEVPVWAS